VELCMFLGVDKATRLQTAFLKKCSDKYFMECFEGRITPTEYNLMLDKRLLKDINQHFIVDDEINEEDFLIILKNYIEVK